MGRTVEDVAILLGALTGIDSTDSKTLASKGNSFTDYTGSLKKDGIDGKTDWSNQRLFVLLL